MSEVRGTGRMKVEILNAVLNGKNVMISAFTLSYAREIAKSVSCAAVVLGADPARVGKIETCAKSEMGLRMRGREKTWIWFQDHFMGDM